MDRKYRDLILSLSPEQRLLMGCKMFDTARALAEAGLTKEPNPNNLPLRTRLFLRFYQRDFSTQEIIKITQALETLSP